MTDGKLKFLHRKGLGEYINSVEIWCKNKEHDKINIHIFSFIMNIA